MEGRVGRYQDSEGKVREVLRFRKKGREESRFGRDGVIKVSRYRRKGAERGIKVYKRRSGCIKFQRER